ncbi:hypothetical protein BU14_0152s0010 [Porphyra umbilicalis]|uniref:Uncharacterized protein n=1 Tax=Porphyra umbilicalis TaxID=2786 RepID=A0A1X6P9B8_PORUM|nr:hypothetical protein BU14_0152s0010 [Porphyra umbilicalis]|eukprot:OSX77315.1 hypothetical protein BU14_0152s0010 [Porphyra umbilicalis]
MMGAFPALPFRLQRQADCLFPSPLPFGFGATSAAMADTPTVRRRETPAAAAAAAAAPATPGLAPVLRPDGPQLSPLRGLQVVLRDKDNVGVLTQFVLFSIAVAALPVGVFFLVLRSLSPDAVDGEEGSPSWLVTAVVTAAPRLFTAARVPPLGAALAAVLAVNVVTGAFVLRALLEDARLVAAVGGAPPSADVAAAMAAAAATAADAGSAAERPKTT